MSDQTVVNRSDWVDALNMYGGESGKFVAQNPKLLASTFDLMKSIAEHKLADGIADGVGLAAGISEKVVTSKNVKHAASATSFVFSQAKLTMSLNVLSDAVKGTRLASPSGVLILVGATVVSKTGLALSLAGDDQEKAKCVAALMEVAGNTAITAVTFETGIGAVLGIAAITASSYNAYLECR